MKGESKSESFRRVSQRRVNKVLAAVKVLANCSNKAVYDYSDDDVERMFSVIQEQLAIAKSKFKHPAATEFKW